MNHFWSGENSRHIIERIIIEGDFVLQTPAHFGNGDGDSSVMELLTDSADPSRAMLPGASIAGALRAYLWSREVGEVDPETLQAQNYRHTLTVSLLGGLRADNDGGQSRLIVDDASGDGVGRIERDGVGINPMSRTAAEDMLYRVQLWSAGTRFTLRFELLIYAGDDRDGLRRALAVALSGLNDGAITLGARKRRGYGRGAVEAWRVLRFDLSTIEGVMAWLQTGNVSLSTIAAPVDLLAALNTDDNFARTTQWFEIDACFTLNGSLLIRSFDAAYTDMRHLHSGGRPVLSGTSLTGALRARAGKILRTIHAQDSTRQDKLMEDIFGSPPRKKEDKTPLKGGKLTVEEHVIETQAPDRVQSRVSIDRFTGGALDTALFTQQPVFESDAKGVRVKLRLRNPSEAEIGLLLLLLKDLWTGDLPLGGEQSVGRGRLRGESATLTDHVQTWALKRDADDNISVTGTNLNEYVAQMHQYLNGGRA